MSSEHAIVFCKAFQAVFSEEQLEFIQQHFSVLGGNDDVDYAYGSFTHPELGHLSIEISTDLTPDGSVLIENLESEEEPERYSPQGFWQMIQQTKAKNMTMIVLD